MNEQRFHKGRVIFYEGYSGDSLYYIFYGTVGIYVNYGKNNQRMLAELTTGDYFGEMGLLDRVPRSATAVALEDNTFVGEITEEGFAEFFRENPARVLVVMQQLSHNLRNRTNEYLKVCREIHELAQEEGMEE